MAHTLGEVCTEGAGKFETDKSRAQLVLLMEQLAYRHYWQVQSNASVHAVWGFENCDSYSLQTVQHDYSCMRFRLCQASSNRHNQVSHSKSEELWHRALEVLQVYSMSEHPHRTTFSLGCACTSCTCGIVFRSRLTQLTMYICRAIPRATPISTYRE